MPWTQKDAETHKKGLTRTEKKKWARIANAVLSDCQKKGGKGCEESAIRIANSKFAFNPALSEPVYRKLKSQVIDTDKVLSYDNNMKNTPIKNKVDFHLHFDSGVPTPASTVIDDETDDVQNISADIKDVGNIDSDDLWLTPDIKERIELKVKDCMALGGSETDCRVAAISLAKRKLNFKDKKFQFQKLTPADPFDGHVHTCAYDENGDGGTDEAGSIPHTHLIYDFRVQPYSTWDADENKSYVSVHPGSLAFGELKEIKEMEIFRAGTHNGDEFTDATLEEMASNFKALKDDLRPKLKITHADDADQKSLAGLASYGDVVDVFVKKASDGTKRLFASLKRVPLEVYNWIKEGRFAERSIEMYPEFKLGTKEDSPVYKNVLKSIALLGHQMPAVTGMAPVKLEECLECQGVSCFRESIVEKIKVTNSKTIDLEFTMFEKRLEMERKVLTA